MTAATLLFQLHVVQKYNNIYDRLEYEYHTQVSIKSTDAVE